MAGESSETALDLNGHNDVPTDVASARRFSESDNHERASTNQKNLMDIKHD